MSEENNDIMASHYDEHYFFANKFGGKKYRDSGDKIKEFGYHDGGLWNFQAILDKLIEILGLPISILDLGAGCGGFVVTATNNGIESLGLEFSQYAVDHAILNSRNQLKLWNIENTPWPVDHQYEWVTAIDLFEHLFDDKVDSIIKEAKRVSSHWIIAKICTAQLPREVWAAKRANYEEVIRQAKEEGFEWLVVSGHVNSQFPDYWIEKFVDSEWTYRADLSARFKKELSLPEDWRSTLILEKKNANSESEVKVQPLGKFTSDYYDKDYFVTPRGKKYHRPDRTIDGWSYSNSTGEYLGAKDIVKSWKTIFNPQNMLDVGCGRGTFLTYARDLGIKADGFDYSEFAIKNPYSRCKPEWIILHDATKPWPYKDQSFDLVTVLDFYEHIYYEDLKFVISEMFRVAKKHIFIQSAVCGGKPLGVEDYKSYILKKGEYVPMDAENTAVAGHVTMITEQAWEDLFDDQLWVRTRDMETWFEALTPSEAIKNWLLNSILVYSKFDEG